MVDETTQVEEAQVQKTELEILKARADMMGIPYGNAIGVAGLRKKIEAKMNDEEPEADETDEDGDEQSTEVNDEVEEVAETVEETEEPAAEPEVTETVAEAPAEPTPTFVPPKPIAPTATVNKGISNAPPSVNLGKKTEGKKLSKSEEAALLRQQLHADYMRLVRVRITNLNPSKKDLNGEIYTFANEFLGTVRKFVPYGEATENGYHIPYCIYLQLEERRFLQISTKKNQRTNTPEVKTGWAREFALEILPQLTEEELAELAAQQAASGSIPKGLED